MTFLLIWFHFVPDQGVKYHQLAHFNNKVQCMSELRIASVLLNDDKETLECIGVLLND